jgi:hypothetical protein
MNEPRFWSAVGGATARPLKSVLSRGSVGRPLGSGMAAPPPGEAVHAMTLERKKRESGDQGLPGLGRSGSVVGKSGAACSARKNAHGPVVRSGSVVGGGTG